MTKKFRIYTDGGSRGNPGPAASGAVLKDLKDGKEGEVIDTVSRYLGKATNNQAEYTAIIIGLERAKHLEAVEVEMYMDSELAVKQLNGEYKVKDPDLAKLFMKVWNLSQSFKKVTYTHVRREKNKEADALVNQSLDAHQ
ncbi:ribonuclease HI family protein [Patescibacteria group bacterium]